MSLVEYLRRQFTYDAWANHEVIRAIQAGGDQNSRSWQLVAHILAAERLWLERLRSEPQSVAVWPQPDPARCKLEAEAVRPR